MIRLLAVGTAALVTVLAGCASYTTPAFRHPPPGNLSLTVHQPVNIKADSSRVYLQDGATHGLAGINIYSPYCMFYAPRPTAGKFTIAPGTFAVHKSYRRIHITSLAPLRVAGGSLDLSGGRPDRTLSVHLELFSAAQPEVRELVCSRWGTNDPWNWATPAQINQALGDYASLRPSS